MLKRLCAFLLPVVILFASCATGGSLPGIAQPQKPGKSGGGLAITTPGGGSSKSSGPSITSPNRGKGGSLPTVTSPKGKGRKGDPFAAGPRKVNVKKKKKEKGLFPKGMRR